MEIWDDSTWPEHREDLRQVLFGHCVLQFYSKNTLVTTSSFDVSKIIDLFPQHPLNTSHDAMTLEEGTRFWNILVPQVEETCTVSEIKAEVSRQVKLYILKGIEVLGLNTSVEKQNENQVNEIEDLVIEENNDSLAINENSSVHNEPSERANNDDNIIMEIQNKKAVVDVENTHQSENDVNILDSDENRKVNDDVAAKEDSTHNALKSESEEEEKKFSKKEDDINSLSKAEVENNDTIVPDNSSITNSEPEESNSLSEDINNADHKMLPETDTNSEPITVDSEEFKENPEEPTEPKESEELKEPETLKLTPKEERSRRRARRRSARSSPEPEYVKADDKDKVSKEVKTVKSEVRDIKETKEVRQIKQRECRKEEAKDIKDGKKKTKEDPVKRKRNMSISKFSDLFDHIIPNFPAYNFEKISEDINSGVFSTIMAIEMATYSMLAHNVIESNEHIPEELLSSLEEALERHKPRQKRHRRA